MITFKLFISESKEIEDTVVKRFAAQAHDEWREQFHKDNPKEKNKPRMRMRGGKMVDINKPSHEVDPAVHADNEAAGRAAHRAYLKHLKGRYRKHGPEMERAAADVHKAWIKRNKSDPNQNQDLMKPYKHLPEDEKEKDRAHIHKVAAIHHELLQGRAALKKVKSGKVFEENE